MTTTTMTTTDVFSSFSAKDPERRRRRSRQTRVGAKTTTTTTKRRTILSSSSLLFLFALSLLLLLSSISFVDGARGPYDDYHGGGGSAYPCASGDLSCELTRLKGGSVAVASVVEDDVEENESVEKDDEDESPAYLDTIVLALLSTCELNRRLDLGTDGATCAGGHDHNDDRDDGHHHDYREDERVHVRPDRAWFRPVADGRGRGPTRTDTVFHERSTFSSSSRRRRLASDLNDLRRRFDCPPVTFALALIYLDRACSAETPRSAPGARACPHVAPDTVRRLAVVAAAVAAEVVSNGSNDDSSNGNDGNDVNDNPLGLSPEAWVRARGDFVRALGDHGTWVDRKSLSDFGDAWRRAFGRTMPGIASTPPPPSEDRAIEGARSRGEEDAPTAARTRNVAYDDDGGEGGGYQQHYQHQQHHGWSDTAASAASATATTHCPEQETRSRAPAPERLWA